MTLRAYKGCVARELQVGTLVVQLPYAATRDLPCFAGRRLVVWRDPDGRWFL